MEYGDVIFDGSPKKITDSLEQVQRQAGLACTGAYMHTSHKTLLEELGWDTLAIRRECHKLTYMYKINRWLVPDYLQSLCTDRVQNRSRYNLRNSSNFILPYTRTVSFKRSFFPSAIRLWNNQDTNIREAPSLASFKTRLKRQKCQRKVPLYSQLNGYGPLNLSRMRMGLSGLNFHRHRVHFIPNSHCPNCAAPREDPLPFLLLCPRFAAPREELLRGVAPVLTPGLQPILPIPNTNPSRRDLTHTLIFGSPTLPRQTNANIFEAVSNFILQTRIF